ncbi:MAG: hypothetical protein ACRDRJ_35720 [Streptosporangiaceae bacterium]
MTDWTETQELRLRASALSYFELPWLGPLPEPAPVDALLQDCYRIAGADGVGHWVMPDAARREILRAAGLDRARQAWRALTTAPIPPSSRSSTSAWAAAARSRWTVPQGSRLRRSPPSRGG